MKNMKIKTWLGIIFGFFSVSILSGCQGDDRLKEVSTLQTQAELKAQKEYQETRAKEFEADLEKRLAFFQAVVGTYEGSAATSNGEYFIRIRLMQSTTPFKPENRVLTIEELVKNLNELHLTAQVFQQKVGSALGMANCTVDNINTDLSEGMIQIASSNCPSFYEFRINDGNSMNGTSAANRQVVRTQISRDISRRLMSGQREPVSALAGEIYPTSADFSYSFTAKRRFEP